MATDKQVEAVARYLAKRQNMNPDLKLSTEPGWPTAPKKGVPTIPLWKLLFEDDAREILICAESAERT